MRDVVTPQFMRLRAKFDASPPTDTALGRFYEVPQWRFHFYSDTQRVVTALEFRKTEFQDRLKYFDDNLVPALAQRALVLAQPIEAVRIGAHDKLQFGVTDHSVLKELGDFMEGMPGTISVYAGTSVGVALERKRYRHDGDQLQRARWALIRAVKEGGLTIERPRLDIDAMQYSREYRRFAPIDPGKV